MNLIVSDGNGNENKGSVSIIDVGTTNKSSGRLSRMTTTVWRVYKEALRIDSDIYHFHDPELIPIGLLLRKKGKNIIYDVHEDLPRQIMGKHYLPKFVRPLISRSVEIIEDFAARRFSAVCTATPHIRDRFLKFNNNTVDINNFPKLEELSFDNISWSNRQNKVCYVGGITQIRGIVELIEAMEDIDGRLDLAGNFDPPSLKRNIVCKPGWQKVNELGFIDRTKIKDILATSKVGVVTFLPLPNHINSQPNKMFEYMAAGIPVVASNFLLWRKILEDNDCGICVNPKEPKSISEAVNYLLNNDNLAKALGQNGRRAVEKKFNWEHEKKKLIDLYQRIDATYRIL